MIKLDVEQGSLEWIQARLGIPTASQFHRILTPKTMKPNSQAQGYLHELLAEQLLGHSIDEATSDFMMRGSNLEASAVEYYELQEDIETERIGFILRDDRRAGCSPDRLVGTNGGLELKCPSAKVHVGYMVDGIDDAYRCQVQGSLYVAEREWWDVLSYNPELPAVRIRTHRDEKFIRALSSAIDQFVDQLLETRNDLIRRGYMEGALTEVRKPGPHTRNPDFASARVAADQELF